MLIIKNSFSKFFQKNEVSSEPKESFQKGWNDLSVFTFQSDGFEINYCDFFVNIKWSSIDKISVYKQDLFTVDLIVFEIIHDDKILILNEEMRGWFQFVLKTKELFSEIPKNWDVEIMHPAFEENYTVLFEKNKS